MAFSSSMHFTSPEMETDTAAAAAISDGLKSKNSIAAFNFCKQSKLVANKERTTIGHASDQQKIAPLVVFRMICDDLQIEFSDT